MGTKFAPSYANLFMGNFENDMIIHSKWMENIIIYKRYIDNFFFIWKGEKEDFDIFVNYLNNNNWGLAFTGNISKTKLEYLNKSIITKTYFKPVDCNSLLNFHSSHYKKWLLRVPYGQFRRLRKNWSRNIDFRFQCKIMESCFRDKGYPVSVINDAINKTTLLTQNDCLQKSTSKMSPIIL